MESSAPGFDCYETAEWETRLLLRFGVDRLLQVERNVRTRKLHNVPNEQNNRRETFMDVVAPNQDALCSEKNNGPANNKQNGSYTKLKTH